MVSTSSVERPELMSWTPSEAKPKVSTILGGFEGSKKKSLGETLLMCLQFECRLMMYLNVNG